jgi:GT2 family glycosyltransferase
MAAARRTPVRPAATPRPRAGGNAGRLEGGLTSATPLADGLLLVLAWWDGAPAVSGKVAVEVEGAAAERPAEILSLPAVEGMGSSRVLGLVCLAEAEDGSRPLPRLRLAAGRKAIEIGPEAIAAATVDLRTFLREHLAGLDAEIRASIVDWLPGAAAAVAGGGTGNYSLSRALQTAHESLREHPEPCVIAPEEPRGLQIDALLYIDPETFWVKGWAMDADAPITGLSAISPSGAAGEFLDRTMRIERPDVEQFYASSSGGFAAERNGFIGLVELSAPSLLANGWVVQMKDSLGVTVEAEAPQVVRDPLTVRSALLGDFELTKQPDHPARPELFEPALTRLQAQLTEVVKIEDVRQHGEPPARPEVSVIVPLYRRIDFLEHQLTQFARDPEIGASDLIYVLDSPEDAEALARIAPEIHALTGVPFRVVTLARNAGFSGANNAAAELARGEKLVLLNSDVLPDRPGWLGTMARFFDQTPGIGALAPKLLYEDDSLQHAGLYFLRAPGSPIWENMHYFKGLNRHTAAANVARRVPAVTGACLMVERERYEELGGLRGQFVQGDYEDSDLCMRLHEQGLDAWYLPDAELYHLEAQSYPNELRRATSAYNTWLHSYLWSEAIAAAMDTAEGRTS